MRTARRSPRPLVGALATLSLLVAVTAANGQASPRLNKYGYPEKHAPEPTSQAITPGDLMTRLYIFADDSMQGRQFGRVGNFKGTTYIASEVKRLGLLPAGDSGTYFQRLPMGLQHFTDKSTLTVDGTVLKFNTDFVPPPTPRAPRPIQNAQVIFGGIVGDTMTMIAPDQVAGKFVVFATNPAAGGGGRGGRAGGGGGGGAGGGAAGGRAAGNPCAALLSGGGAGRAGAGFAGGAGGRAGFAGGAQPGNAPINLATRYATAAAIATIDLDNTPIGQRAYINTPAANPRQNPPATPRAPIVFTQNGQIATIQNGQLVGGQLPAGMTPQMVQQMRDSIRADSGGVAQRAAAFSAQDRTRACEVIDSIAVSHGATSMKPPAGAAPDPGAAAGAAAAGAGGGGRAGGAGGGGGAGGRAGGGRNGGGGPVDPNGTAASIRITKAAAERLFGRSVDGMTMGTTGKTVTGALDWEDKDASDWARNVVAVVPGSDPVLKNQYVLVSAHNDHNGYSVGPVDHDSLKAYNDIRTRMALSVRAGDLATVPGAELQAIRINVDSLHKIRPARLDSITNGADDDGSGSMAILEIAEFVAKMAVKPKRSTIFVWQTGEERGLNGSAYFAAHPTVPIDSIVADINIDMIGRGRAEDIPGGGPTYVGVVGSGFLSKDLAGIVAATNMKQKQPLALDPKFDLTTTWPGYNNIYGRSDHYNYARQCIPIAFFFTGLHGDYHQRTDEPQYIDYPHYSAITNYVKDVVVELGTRAQRPSLDKPCIRA